MYILFRYDLATLSPSGKLIVGQQVVESTPGLVAMVAAMGAKHVFSWKGVEKMLIASGYELERRYLLYLPYYIAIWNKKKSRS